MFSISPVISSRLRVPGLFPAMVLRDADKLASRTRSWPIAVHDPGWNISKQGIPVVRASDILGVRKHDRMSWALRMTDHNGQQVGLRAFTLFSTDVSAPKSKPTSGPLERTVLTSPFLSAFSCGVVHTPLGGSSQGDHELNREGRAFCTVALKRRMENAASRPEQMSHEGAIS